MSKIRIYNKNLCPDLWSDMKLDPKVRIHLLKVAKDFYEKTTFEAPIKDVYVMGSIANYNWTPESDVDVHILIDFNQLKMEEETASKMARTVSSQWNSEHEITAKSHPVEMNLQNSADTKPHVTGIYSLVTNSWIRMPKKENISINRAAIIAQYNKLRSMINKAINSGDKDYMNSFKDYIDSFRQYGLDTKGEISTENIVFKILRSSGLIKKLKDSITDSYDKTMSVHEVIQQDIKSTFPPPSAFVNKKPQFSLMTLDNIKSLRDKAGRNWKVYQKQNDTINARKELDNFSYYNDELKRRLKLINSKMEEASDTDPYYKKMDSDERYSDADGYFKIGHGDFNDDGEGEEGDSENPNYVWIWDGTKILTGVDGTHGTHFTHDVSGRNFKGRYDTRQNAISVAFPERFLRKLGGRRPTRDDIPTQVYNKLLSKFNTKNPRIEVWEEGLSESDSGYDAAEDFFERRRSQMIDLVNLTIKNKGQGKVPWRTISATLLKKVWLLFGKYNKINDNALDKIADQMLTNIARLRASTELLGHAENNPRSEVEEEIEREFTDEEWNQIDEWFSDYLTDEKGSWRLSDSALKPLEKLYGDIFSKEGDEKLYAIDKALNIIHPRGDLAAMFIEGGSKTLMDIFNQGGFTTDVEEGFGAGKPEEDPKIPKGKRWTVKYDSTSSILKNEGFDPQSNGGPNPYGQEGGQPEDFYQDKIMTMQQMEEGGKFRNSKNIEHIIDVPMFSIFVYAGTQERGLIERNIEDVKRIFNDAKHEIHKIGFPSMHSNVVIYDMSNVNKDDRERYQGAAIQKLKYMMIDPLQMFSQGGEKIIVHEWAHLWMYNNGKKFASAIQQTYQSMVQKSWKNPDMQNQDSFKGPDYSLHRTKIATLNNWANEYGMTNKDELWATGIEDFFDLQPEHRKMIIKLMLGGH